MPGVVELLEASPELISRASGTQLIDEWQRYPASWDLVRRAVDDGAAPGSYLLTGSAYPTEGSRIHSGAARIDSVRMRPFGMQERKLAPSLLKISTLFDATTIDFVAQEVAVNLSDYATEICRSGLPGIMNLPERIRTARLDSYIERLATHEFAEQGINVRNPGAVTRWLAAYAAATARTTSYTEILDSATPGEANKPSRTTADSYRNLLEQLMILEPLAAWNPLQASLGRLAQSPKHHLCDPALAARLLGASPRSLVGGDPQQSELLAQLFESLVVLTARVSAEAIGARCFHLRTRNGDHEVDIIVENPDKRIVAIEVKLSPIVKDNDVQHLAWLRDALGSRFAAGLVVHAGPHFYQRPDGIWVVPLAVLG